MRASAKGKLDFHALIYYISEDVVNSRPAVVVISPFYAYTRYYAGVYFNFF